MCRSTGSDADEDGDAIARLQQLMDDIKAQAQRDKARKRQAIIKARRHYWPALLIDQSRK